jgi:YgiT-type zinc finger domain-containing protein
MECFYCKGKMKKGKTSYVVNRRGYHLVLDQVPAFICGQCGEPYFEPEGVELVQQMIREIDQKAEELLLV